MKEEHPRSTLHALRSGDLSAAQKPAVPLTAAQREALSRWQVLDMARARKLGVTTDASTFEDAIYRGTPIRWAGRQGLFVGLDPERQEPVLADSEEQLAEMSVYFDQKFAAQLSPGRALFQVVSPQLLFLVAAVAVGGLLVSLMEVEPHIAMGIIIGGAVGAALREWDRSR